MSGILDNKSRVLDTIVTLEGRRQISSGDLKVRYVSFTDASTYYAADILSGTADATTRIYLEQCSLPQDQITFEADDSGRLKPFKNDSDITVKDGQLITYSFNALTASVLTGSNQTMQLLRGDEFASTAQKLLESSIHNFCKLRLIGTKDKLFEDDGFSLGNKEIEFVINNDRPIKDPSDHAANINHLDSLFNDVRLSKVKNFMYLPPVNKISDDSVNKKDHKATWKYQLGHYPPWGRTHLQGLSSKQLEHELKHYERTGYCKSIFIDPTSRQNNIVGQFFEVDHHVMHKLDIIDYGKYVWHGSVKHAFFVGKVMNDENNNHTFIHIFTIVFG